MRAPIHRWQRSRIIIGALALWGCTTWRVQNVAPMVFVMEAKPSAVRIERVDASRVVLAQPVVVGDSIWGQQGAVAAADVKSIAIRRFDVPKTLGLMGGILAAAGVASWMIIWDKIEDEWPNRLR